MSQNSTEKIPPSPFISLNTGLKVHLKGSELESIANMIIESLKQLMIIERTPEPENSPTPSPAPDVNLDNLTAAQKERLKAFLRNEGIAVSITMMSRHT